MKKMLALLMALLMLVLCSATAETTVQTQALLSPDGSYGFDVPADYIVMNSQIMKTLFTSDEMRDMLAQMFGLEDASQLDAYFAVIEASNMLFVYSGDMTGNVNAQTNVATMTMEQMVLFKSLLDTTIVQQYCALGAKEEDITLMGMQEVGGRQWYAIQVVLSGMTINSRMTIVDGVQYTLTFSGMEEDVMQLVLESFQVNAAFSGTQLITSPEADPLNALQTLASPNGDYHFDVPADFIPVNSETMKSYFVSDATQQSLAVAMGLEDASQLAAYFDAIQASNMMVVYDSNLAANLNIQATTATMTMEQMVQMKSLLDASIIQQYAALGVSEEDITLLDIQTIGDHQWYGTKLVFYGMNMQTMMTVENGCQYTITFTLLDDAVVQTVLESFQVVAAE